MNINVVTIPHNTHRYETVGDWWFDGFGNLEIRVSKTGDERYEQLVAIHEIIEALLCKQRGISEKEVSDFDILFEQKRAVGNTDEPGDAPDAPYRKEHFFATSIERLIAGEFQVNWSEYEKVLETL